MSGLDRLPDVLATRAGVTGADRTIGVAWLLLTSALYDDIAADQNTALAAGLFYRSILIDAVDTAADVYLQLGDTVAAGGVGDRLLVRAGEIREFYLVGLRLLGVSVRASVAAGAGAVRFEATFARGSD